MKSMIEVSEGFHKITLDVPDWFLWVLCGYMIVSAICNLQLAYYKKKEIELKYWDKN